MSLYSIIQMSRNPEIQNWFEKERNYNLFEAEILTVAAKIKALVHNLT